MFTDDLRDADFAIGPLELVVGLTDVEEFDFSTTGFFAIACLFATFCRADFAIELLAPLLSAFAAALTLPMGLFSGLLFDCAAVCFLPAFAATEDVDFFESSLLLTATFDFAEVLASTATLLAAVRFDVGLLTDGLLPLLVVPPFLAAAFFAVDLGGLALEAAEERFTPLGWVFLVVIFLGLKGVIQST